MTLKIENNSAILSFVIHKSGFLLSYYKQGNYLITLILPSKSKDLAINYLTTLILINKD
jgi:hypothetical protein